MRVSERAIIDEFRACCNCSFALWSSLILSSRLDCLVTAAVKRQNNIILEQVHIMIINWELDQAFNETAHCGSTLESNDSSTDQRSGRCATHDMERVWYSDVVIEN